MASDVSDIPSDRALVPNLVDRAFMSKYNHDQAFASKDDSASNSDPLVWGVRVDDHTQPADPVKVGHFDPVHSDICVRWSTTWRGSTGRGWPGWRCSSSSPSPTFSFGVPSFWSASSKEWQPYYPITNFRWPSLTGIGTLRMPSNPWLTRFDFLFFDDDGCCSSYRVWVWKRRRNAQNYLISS